MQRLKNRIVFSFREILYLNGFRTTGDFKVIVKDIINQKPSVDKKAWYKWHMHPDPFTFRFPRIQGTLQIVFFFYRNQFKQFFLPKSIQTVQCLVGSLGLVVTTINEADVQSASVIINKNNAQVQDI